jgi:hypothetical protein
MFSSGMKESRDNQIEIPDIRYFSNLSIMSFSYNVFTSIIRFLYTGEFTFTERTKDGRITLEALCEILKVSDQFMLDQVENLCLISLGKRTL